MNVPSVMQSLVEKLHNISEDTTSHAEFERGIRDVTGIAYAGQFCNDGLFYLCY